MPHSRDPGSVMIASAVVLLIAVCVIVQSLIASGGIARQDLWIEKVEGQVVWAWSWPGSADTAPAGPAAESGGILLALPEASESVLVLVNGRVVADFRYEQAAAVVRRGDLVEIEVNDDRSESGANLAGLQVEVVATTPNVKVPLQGVRVHLTPGRTTIASIII